MSRRRDETLSFRTTLLGGVALLAVVGGIATIQAVTSPTMSSGDRLVILAIAAIGGVVALRSLRRPPDPEIRIGDFLAMSPPEFEEAVASILERYGYRLRVVGGAGDLGADIIGRAPAGESVVIQCKRYAPGSQIGSPDIQKLIGMGRVHHRASSLIFVTTARFSGPAVELAAQHDIVLVDGARLVSLTVPRRSKPTT